MYQTGPPNRENCIINSVVVYLVGRVGRVERVGWVGLVGRVGLVGLVGQVVDSRMGDQRRRCGGDGWWGDGVLPIWVKSITGNSDH